MYMFSNQLSIVLEKYNIYAISLGTINVSDISQNYQRKNGFVSLQLITFEYLRMHL